MNKIGITLLESVSLIKQVVMQILFVLLQKVGRKHIKWGENNEK